MKSSLEIFELIRSLSPSEKRYVRLELGGEDAKGYGGMGLIFNAIQKGEAKSDKEVMTELPPKVRVQYPVLKNHLYKAILRALRSFHSGNTLDFQLKELLMNVEVLLRKDLHHHCRKMLDKVRDLALANERFEYLPEVFSHYITLAMKNPEADLEALDQRLDTLFSETRMGFQVFTNILEFKKMSMKMLVLNRQAQHLRGEEVENAYGALIHHPLMQEDPIGLSTRAKLYRAQILFIYNFAAKDYAQSYLFAKEIVALFEDQPFLIGERPENYFNALQNQAMIGTAILSAEEVRALVSQLKNIEGRYPKISFGKGLLRRSLLTSAYLELTLCLTHRDYALGLEVIPQIEAELKDSNLRPNVNEGYVLLDIWSCIAHIYLGLGRYADALVYLNRILFHQHISPQYDLFLKARILQTIALFETGETRLMESSLISLYRLLKKREQRFLTERALLQFIRKTSRHQPGRDPGEAFRVLREELPKLLEDPFERSAFDPFDLLGWLSSKTGGLVDSLLPA